MPSNFLVNDSIMGQVDLDDYYITDQWFLDRYGGSAMWNWGYGFEFGALGNNDLIDRSSPIQIGALTNWYKVATGRAFMLAIKTDGTLWSWGDNSFGNLGIGKGDTVDRSSPTQVGSLTTWKDVSTADGSAGFGGSSFAIRTNDTLWSWGDNTFGQLGDGTTTGKLSPIQVGALSDWEKLAICDGTNTTMYAIKVNGTLWGWGSNFDGKLGDGTIVNKSSPVQIGALTNWKKIFVNDRNTAAIKTDGTLWLWGNNSRGQLGQSDTVHRSSPIQVGSLTDWKDVAMTTPSSSTVAAIKTNGTLWTWGDNFGRLGIGTWGTPAARSSPVQVGSLTNWKTITGRFAAIKTDGTLWMWGNNSSGELGQGDIVHRSSPTQVGSLTNWKRTSTSIYLTSGLTYEDY